MRRYHDFFEFLPHPAPWHHSFGHWCHDRPPFNSFGWLDFDRCSCRPHGRPGFNPRSDFPHHEFRHHCHRNPPPPESHEEGHYGLTDHHHHGPPGFRNCVPENRHGPGCGRRGSYEDFRTGFGHHRVPKHHNGFPGCNDCHERGRQSPPEGHRGPPDHVSHGHAGHRGPPDHAGQGHGAHSYVGLGHSDHGHGHGFRPHCGKKFRGHCRPHPYVRHKGCLDGEGDNCRKRPCCLGNRDEQVCNHNRSNRHETEPCDERNIDTTENTVLVQKIVVATAPKRPQSI